ncbi:MAG: cystathionine beta-synthase [Planctomycetota bacterium]|nr:cystathionine beta-synthase [Planctomycetota bacterium]
MKFAKNILGLIGNTPLLRLNKVTAGVRAPIYVKMEYLNPGGSVKDRIGIQMLEDAEKAGLIKPGGTIIEGTSGNTGLGLLLAAITKGYRCIFIMPDKMSQEKIDVLKAFGAEVVVTPTAVEPEDPRSYYSVSARLAREIPNSYYPNQYQNPSNPKTHYQSTGPEIWEQTDGEIYAFVAGMGTGGTLSGTGKYLKEKNPDVQIVGVDPVGSMYYDKFHSDTVIEAKTYLVEGIGEDFFPSTMNLDILDDVIQIDDRSCFVMTRQLARQEGVFTGGSGGAAVWAAIEYAKKHDLTEDQPIIVLLPDTGMRYLSKIFSDDWMTNHGFMPNDREGTVGELLNTKTTSVPSLIAVEPEALAYEALRLMKEYEVDQIPVIKDGEVKGTIREEQMFELFLNKSDPQKVTISDIMGEGLPVVDESTSIDDISLILTKGPKAVLVKSGDKQYGIVTKGDLISRIAR